MKDKIIEIIGHGMEPERAELMADQILALRNTELILMIISEVESELNKILYPLVKYGMYNEATEVSIMSKKINHLYDLI
jgi:hypothetical protein